MSNTDTKALWGEEPIRVIGFLAGLIITSVSLSSGFIWVCGNHCMESTVVWTADRRPILAFLAAFTAWWGYLVAHRAVTGQFIDSGEHGDTDENGESESKAPTGLADQVIGGMAELIPSSKLRQAGFLLGIGMLVSGIVVGFVYIRQGNHLLTNVGGALFLGGYVVAHYAETGTPL